MTYNEKIKGDPGERLYMALFMALAATVPPMGRTRKIREELEGIDIEAEYALIQQKKSRLSRRLRDKVEARHERVNG